MQCDAVERDHETDGGEHDGRDPAGLFPDSLFKARVAAFKFRVAALDTGFEGFVHSGLHKFGLGGCGGFNSAGQRRGLDFGEAGLFQLFRDG
jgi:hypothetical protein